MAFDPKIARIMSSTDDDEFSDDPDAEDRARAKWMLLNRDRPRGPRREPEGPQRDEHGRFVKGVTGNPLGRRPRIKFAKSEPAMFFNTQIELNRNGETVQVSREEAFLEKTFALAMAGRATAMRMIDNQIARNRAEQLEARYMLRYLYETYMTPGGEPPDGRVLRIIDELVDAITLGDNPRARALNRDHARSFRRRRLKARKAAEAEAAEKAAARAARRAARKPKAKPEGESS